MKEQKNSHKYYDTDVAAVNIWLSLVRDFRVVQGKDFAKDAVCAFLGGIPQFRDYNFPELGVVPPLRYKMYYQLASLFKKYRFSNDKYTDEELHDLTIAKFFREQERFATPLNITPLLHLVIQCARKHARRILGKYDPAKTVMEARFGKKSSIGCPLNLAYIDHKLTSVEAFTGSKECSKWFFEDHLNDDPILKRLVTELGVSRESERLSHESLSLVNVPKSWKTHRPITPLTLLSLFYSYGVGAQVEQALVKEGLDISRLQKRHRLLVKEYSVTRKGTTADLENASNSLTSELLNRLLPREWYVAIKRTFSRQLLVNGKEQPHYTASVLPMGNGLTFPVETLVFYILLKAIEELADVKGISISVYGDDLIYPSRLHKYVAVIFPQLGLRINADKTFCTAPFRESCGSDYYQGVDVRPCFLPDEHQLLTRSKYAAWLYKVYNGLQRRWDEVTIRSTLLYILTELSRLGLTIHRVPESYPDLSGIKVSTPGVIPLGANVLDWSPILIKFYSGSRWFHFSYLSQQPEKRVVESVTPHYWLALQGKDDDILADEDFFEKNFWHTDFSVFTDLPRPHSEALKRKRHNHIHELGGSEYSPIDNPRTPLIWKTFKRERYKTIKGKRKLFIVEKTLAYSNSRTLKRISVNQTKPETISDWI